MDWVGHFGKFERTLWDLVVFSQETGSDTWFKLRFLFSHTSLRCNLYLKDFSLPRNWALICQKKLHCPPSTKVYFFNHSFFILITFVNLLVFMSVNSSMLALDEKKSGVGIAAFCSIYLQKTSGFQNSLLRSFHSSFQWRNFIFSSLSAWLHLIISLLIFFLICCTVLCSHLCCIFLLSETETELNKSWYIFICWFSMCRLVWKDFFFQFLLRKTEIPRIVHSNKTEALKLLPLFDPNKSDTSHCKELAACN